MNRWLQVSRSIDRVTGRIGRWTSWLCLLMVLVTAYNTVVRYLGRFIGLRLSSNLYLELQWYLFSLLFLFGRGRRPQGQRTRPSGHPVQPAIA